MYGFRAKLATMGAGKTEDLIREYYTGQSGRLKNIVGFQTACRLRNENYY